MQALYIAHFLPGDIPLYQHVHNIFVALLHRCHGLDVAVRIHRRPCVNLLVEDIREAGHCAIAAHKVQRAVRLLLIGAVHNLYALDNVLCQERQIVAAVAIGIVAISHIAHRTAAPLHEHDTSVRHNRLAAAATAGSLHTH